jgi:hypothetical protein
MGMFDEFAPTPAVECPYCGTTLIGWQGKDGPCALFVWRQGLAAPLEQMIDDDCRLPADKMAKVRLPERFRFGHPTAGCRYCPVAGIGRTENGVWVETTLILLSDAPYCEQVDLNDGHEFSPHSWRRGEG